MNKLSDQERATGSSGFAPRHLDRGVVERLLDDVGTDYAQPVIDAFASELASQTDALKAAADTSNPDAMADAAHRLKSTAASFGARRLADVCVAIEQSARAGQTTAALEFMAEFTELAAASDSELRVVRDELFGPPRG